MSDHVWSVPATVLQVIDGETLLLHLDLGWHIYLDVRCRLIGISVPEAGTEAGNAATQWVRDRIGYSGPEFGPEVTFVSHALDSLGRPIGQVMVTTPQGESFDLGLELMNAGLAVPMVGG